MKEKEEQVKENDNQTVVTSAKKPKRFATYQEAFAYFLKIIQFDKVWIYEFHMKTSSRSQRRWLKEIARQTLSKAIWYKDLEGNWQLKTYLDKEDMQKNEHREFFSREEYEEIISWELIDFTVREIVKKESFLSRNLREYTLEIFNWVNHFTAKEGEEVTANIEDFKEKSIEDIVEDAKESLEHLE